jgi:5-methylcytosine-specific restriction endonuclease McrA
MKVKKKTLMGYANGLRKRLGLPQNGTTIVDIVKAAGGNPENKPAAWSWLKADWEENCAPHLPQSRHPSLRRRAGVGFYDSDQWRALRFAALKASNGQCVLCGRSSREHRVVLHVDHIKPRSRWPELELEASNLQVLCADCNLGKSNRDDTDWRPKSVAENEEFLAVLAIGEA